MERTFATVALLLAVTGSVLGAPQPTLNLLGGGHAGRHRGLLGHIINSTADILLKPLSSLGGGGHHGESSTGPDSKPAGSITLPNSDASTYRPTSQGVPLASPHAESGGGNGVDSGGGSDSGIGPPQTSETTQNSVDLAIHEIFGSEAGPGSINGQPQSITHANTEGNVSNQAAGGPNNSGGVHEESTPSPVDIAIQEIFGGGGSGEHFGKPLSNESSNGVGSNNPENHKEEYGDSSSSDNSQNGEHKQSTSNPIDAAILDVFGSPNIASNASKYTVGINGGKGNSGDSGFDSKPSSGINLNSGGSADPAILEILGEEHEAEKSIPKRRFLIFTP